MALTDDLDLIALHFGLPLPRYSWGPVTTPAGGDTKVRRTYTWCSAKATSAI